MPRGKRNPTVLALVPTHTPADDTRLTAITGMLTDLSTAQKNHVVKETEAFLLAYRTAAHSYLAMGEHLDHVREVLEPLEKWKAYINLLPNISQATAYRMIWAWQNATKALPPATRQVAILDGYKLISSKKDETFAPGYEEAVKAVKKDLGNPPERDETKARAWLQAVMQKKRELSKTSKPSTRGSAPAAIQVEATEKRLIRIVEQFSGRLDSEQKKEFGLRVAGMIMTACECPTYKTKPVPIPKDYQLKVA